LCRPSIVYKIQTFHFSHTCDARWIKKKLKNNNKIKITCSIKGGYTPNISLRVCLQNIIKHNDDAFIDFAEDVAREVKEAKLIDLSGEPLPRQQYDTSRWVSVVCVCTKKQNQSERFHNYIPIQSVAMS